MSDNYKKLNDEINISLIKFGYFRNHSRRIVINLLSEIIKTNKIKKILNVCQSYENLHDKIFEGNSHEVCSFYELTKMDNDASFDLIFVFLPLPIKKLPSEFMESLFRKLDSNGLLMLPLVNSNFITSNKSENIREICAKNNCAINAVIRLPEKSLVNSTIDIQLTLISKKITDLEYIFEFPGLTYDLGRGLINKTFNILCNDYSEKIYNLLNSKIKTTSETLNNNFRLHSGVLFKKGEFKSFEFHKTSNEIKKLENDYSEFSFRTIEELAIEVNTTEKKKFTEKENSLYIPLIFNKKFTNKYNSTGQSCVSELNDVKIAHRNVCQIVLNSKLINSQFAAFFLNSKLGHKYRLLLATGFTIPKITKSNIHKLKIPIIEINKQKEIIEIETKLISVFTEVEKLKFNFVENPILGEEEIKKVENISSSVIELSSADKIKSLSKMDESKILEFKQYFSLDLKKNTKEKYIEDSIMKTICGFFNSNGGVLLVGITDRGEISGIDLEIEKFHMSSNDKFLKHFKNKFKENIGEQNYPLVDYELVSVNGKNVLSITCKRSKKEIFDKHKNFYVRTNPATDKLDGKDLVEYIDKRFR